MAFDELLANRVRTCLQQAPGSARRRCSATWPSWMGVGPVQK